MARLVALQVARGPRFAALLKRIWDEGDAVLPLAPGLPSEAVQDILLRLRPEMLIDEAGQVAIESPAPVPDGTAAVVLTSGTTGVPKGAVLSHDAMAAAATASAGRLGEEEGDRWLCVVPLHHVAGLQILVRSRRDPVIHPGFDVGAIEAQRDVNMISVVPTMLKRLVDADADLERFRVVLVGGAAVPTALIEDARERGANVVRTYGMTETCGGVVYDGRPLDGVRVRVTGGLVEIAGPMLMDGYRFRDEGSGLSDGWFRTTDLGEIDADGTLQVLGRSDDVIVTGGENIPPRPIEEILRTHPAVVDARVAGEPDDEWGSVVVARIVVEGPAPEPGELRSLVSDSLSPAHVPKRFDVVRALDEERKLLD